MALSRPKLPQAGLGQRIATIALLLLALIAAIALLSRGSDDGRSSGPAPSPFTAQSYGSDTSASGGSDGSSSSPSSSQARGGEDGVLFQMSWARFQSRSDEPPIRPTPIRVIWLRMGGFIRVDVKVWREAA